MAIRNLAANATSRCFPKINDLIVRFVEKCESALNYEGGYRYFRVMLGENLGETSEPSPAIMYYIFSTTTANAGHNMPMTPRSHTGVHYRRDTGRLCFR